MPHGKVHEPNLIESPTYNQFYSPRNKVLVFANSGIIETKRKAMYPIVNVHLNEVVKERKSVIG